MKVNTQPMSTFAVYSENLKKKKKSKPQVSNVNTLKKTQVPNGVNKVRKVQGKNGINKLEKTEISNVVNKAKKGANKKTWQMKEIGYLLQKLAGRSVDTSRPNPRGASLLNSISEANEKLDHDDSAHLKDTIKNVTVVENLKKKAKSSKDLNRKKASKSTKDCALIGDGLDAHHSILAKSSQIGNLKHKRKDCIPDVLNAKLLISSENELRDPSKSKAAKMKKATPNEGVGLSLRGTNTKKKKLKLPSEKELLKRKSSDQFQILKKRAKKKLPKIPKNSVTMAKQLFEWLIIPVSEYFMCDFWEKQPLLIQREGNRNYYSELLSTETIDTVLRENNVRFTKHLDVTSYTDGVRETHNLTGRAQANVVWDFYSNGCSIRLLNPQIFFPTIHALNATLQEFFGCFVGANVYLTPPNSQGFSPYYDNIEAFVLQVEGKKRWKVYTPRTDAEVLPRFSSKNFSQEEVGEPFLDVTLEPGDLLYFPRGFIHQASTVEGEHSLHITLSAYKKTSWIGLLEKVLPIALKKAAENDVEFRRGLPRDCLGLKYHRSPRKKRSFVNTAQTLMDKLGHYVQLSLGAVVDQMGAQFMHDALPPVLTPSEKPNTSVGGGLKLKNGRLEGRVEFEMDTCVKLTRYHVCRLVEEENEVRLYHCPDNSLGYHGEEPQFLVLPAEGVQVITHLQASYPAFVSIKDIPHEDQEALITLISDLWDAGLLSAKELPLVEESSALEG